MPIIVALKNSKCHPPSASPSPVKILVPGLNGSKVPVWIKRAERSYSVRYDRDNMVMHAEIYYVYSIIRAFDGARAWVCVLAPVACEHGNTYIFPIILF